MNQLLNDQIPYFRCSDQSVVETYYYLWAIYFMYFIDVDEGYMEYPHTQTAINNFMGLHLWDSSVYARMGSWVVDKWEYGFGNVLNWGIYYLLKKMEAGCQIILVLIGILQFGLLQSIPFQEHG